MKRLDYYAVALNASRKIEQLFVTRIHDGDVRVSNTQRWTGVIYKSMSAAYADLSRLNAAARFVPVLGDWSSCASAAAPTPRPVPSEHMNADVLKREQRKRRDDIRQRLGVK